VSVTHLSIRDSRQARFDADPSKLKGQIVRKDRDGQDHRAAGDFDDDDEDDYDDDEGEDDDSEMEEDGEENEENGKGKREDSHEVAYQRRLPANGSTKVEKPRLPIKLASGKLVQAVIRPREHGISLLSQTM